MCYSNSLYSATCRSPSINNADHYWNIAICIIIKFTYIRKLMCKMLRVADTLELWQSSVYLTTDPLIMWHHVKLQFGVQCIVVHYFINYQSYMNAWCFCQPGRLGVWDEISFLMRHHEIVIHTKVCANRKTLDCTHSTYHCWKKEYFHFYSTPWEFLKYFCVCEMIDN